MRTFVLLAAALIVAAVTAGAGPAAAQSFDCRSPAAQRCPELVICQTPQLATLDSEMSQLYFSLQRQTSRRGAQALLSSQRAWLAGRNSCECNANCLVNYYTSRISLFREILN